MPKRRVKRHAVTQPLDKSIRLIPLTQGQNTIVDARDYEWLSRWNWYAQWNSGVKNFYAKRSTRDERIFMHRQILSCPFGREADHINRNTLDNRRSNLRECTREGNIHNRPAPGNNTSRLKGVSRNKGTKTWRAQITSNGKYNYLGSFKTPEEAAQAYAKAAQALHGEFANIGIRESL